MEPIYFDNNATTLASAEVIKTMSTWLNRGNPSASYEAAKTSQKMFDQFRAEIAKNLGVTSFNGEGTPKAQDYYIIFTSCATESNAMAVNCVTTAYNRTYGLIPHVIASAVEHKALIQLLTTLSAIKSIELTILPVTPRGNVEIKTVQQALRNNTCMVCIMHANNETGAVNDVEKIGKVIPKNVVFHVDAVQTLGRIPPNMQKAGITSLSGSFHKLGAPVGVGLYCIRANIWHGKTQYLPLLPGTQNFGLRGGTENTHTIAASFAALKKTLSNRFAKNEHLQNLRVEFVQQLANRRYRIVTFIEYVTKNIKPTNKPIIVTLSLFDSNSLPNTILISIARSGFCNVEFKNRLESRGIIVSVGSACNTASKYSSHVLDAMNADQYIRQGAIRISFGDSNTIAQVKKFVSVMHDILIEMK